MTLLNTISKEETVVRLTTKIVLIVEYDGRRYYGFQWQDGVPTVQGEIEKALEKLTGEKTRVVAASRTDTGVHARGQVVSFRTRSTRPLKIIISGFNYHLPRDIAVRAAYQTADSFSVQRSVTSREYRYHILNSLTRSPLSEGFVYRVGEPLDLEAMDRASQALIGEHDYASFTTISGAVKKTARRVYRAGVKKDGELVVFDIVASSFLTHQVRLTVGTLLQVGRGRMNSEEFYRIMEAKQPGLAGPMAPADGLCLMQVNYPHPFTGGEIC